MTMLKGLLDTDFVPLVHGISWILGMYYQKGPSITSFLLDLLYWILCFYIHKYDDINKVWSFEEKIWCIVCVFASSHDPSILRN